MSQTEITLSKRALYHNITLLKKKLPKKSKLMCVIKANAYGHGFDEIAYLLTSRKEVDSFAVFLFEDAIKLRKYTQKQILVLQNTDTSFWDEAVSNKITVTISSFYTLEKLRKYQNKRALYFHIKIDSGLSRQGFLPEDMDLVIGFCKDNMLLPTGLYSHFAGMEEKEFDWFSSNQVKILDAWRDMFSLNGIYPEVHMSATSGLLRNDTMYTYDMIRLGIGLYGLYPSLQTKKDAHIKKIQLKPILQLTSYVSEIKIIEKNSFIAYDLTHQVKKRTKIAIIPIGYFDGIPRALSNKGFFLINGKKAPILGRVMMNMCVVNVSSIANVKEGDKVTCIGYNGKNYLSAEVLAELSGTIHYELVTKLGSHIRRRIIL